MPTQSTQPECAERPAVPRSDRLVSEGSWSATDLFSHEHGTRSARAAWGTSSRRLVDPTACESGYANAELEFIQAMMDYKMRSGRNFPTWSEVLEVLKGLGYQKIATTG